MPKWVYGTPMNHCYVLWNGARTHTYAGYTVDPARRLRQHNGELVGGARATSLRGPSWEFLLLIRCGAWTKRQALSLEWYLKNHRRGWSSACADPVDRRFDLLGRALAHEKFRDLEFEIWVHPDERHRAPTFANATLLDAFPS